MIQDEIMKLQTYKMFEGDSDIYVERDDVLEVLKQQPCEDCISRQSAIFLASDLKQDLPDDERISDMVMAHNEGILEYQTQLSLLSPVTPQPKTGHWIKHEHNGIGHIECSECLCWFLEAHLFYNGYCPNCGAKMERLRNDNSREK